MSELVDYNRCQFQDCRKKIKLGQQTKCKCLLFFCLSHRYSDEHNCTYDYRAEKMKKIERDNPKIIPEKITKI
jgi:hypothetical protein